MNALDRLKLFLKENKIGQTKFEEQAGFGRGYISKIKGSIGSDLICKMSEVFPNLNIDWLITGRGDMLISDNMNVSVGRDNSGVAAGVVNGVITHTGGGSVDNRSYVAEKIIRENGDTELYNDTQSVIERLEVENLGLKQRVSDLENMVVSKDELISSLKDMVELLKHR